MSLHFSRACRSALLLDCTPRARILAAALAAFVPLSISLGARADSRSGSDYRFPLMTWFSAYADGAKEAHYEVSTNLEIPAIWLFSPTGALVRKISSGDEATLDQLAQKFPPSEAQLPSKNAPNLDAMNASFVKAGGTAQHPAATSGKAWTAVLFLSDSPACEHCGPYDRKISEVQKKHPDEIDVVRVTLTD